LKRKLLHGTRAALIAAALLAFLPAAAFTSSLRTDFFSEGISARSSGMGNAFIGVADDISALYWNPAGLALLQGNTFATTRTTQDLFDLTTQTLSYAMPAWRGAAGFHIVYSSYGEGVACSGDPRTDCNPILIGEDDTAFSFSYGRKWSNNLLLGASVKSVTQKITPAGSLSGIGFDIGALMDVSENMRAGLVLQNVGNLSLGIDNVPMNVRLGASYNVPNYKGLLLAFSYESAFQNESTFNIGAEYSLSENLQARIGSAGGNFTAGLGVRFENIQLDYAFNRNEVLGDQSRLTLGYYVAQRQPKPKAKVEEKKPEETKTEKLPERGRRPTKAEPAETAKAETKTEPKTEAKTEQPAAEKPSGRAKRTAPKEEPAAKEEPASKPVAEKKVETVGGSRSISETTQPESKTAAAKKRAAPVVTSESGMSAEGEGAVMSETKTELPSLDDLLGPAAAEPEKVVPAAKLKPATIGEGAYQMSEE
jgi:hypothetical protein